MNKIKKMPPEIDLPKLLRERRKHSGLSQTEFARLIGIGRPCYAAYEEGRSQPSIEGLLRISFTFGYSSVDEFLDITRNGKKETPIQLKYSRLKPEAGSEGSCRHINERLSNSHCVAEKIKVFYVLE